MVGNRAAGRLAIIAGSGKLPRYVAEAARARGDEPFIFALKGESTADWADFEHIIIGLGDIVLFRKMAADLNILRIIMSGAVSRRPPFAEIRLGLSSLLKLPSVIRKLVAGGDNTVLTGVIELLENGERKVISVQDVAPSLLAETGTIGNHQPDSDSLKDIAVAARAARMIGTLDIGQGAIAVGGRVVALEGPEGTDAMIARVGALKDAGKVSAHRRGVLVKLCKPQQDVRVDLPSAGLATLENARAAGLAGVALEAGRSLLLDVEAVKAYADKHGMFVYGIDPDAPELGG
ncbi:UDP-2,3-diacylglucosamine diphosphatase LpxI [Rhizobium sp. KVB221]|uniref:UDP-2,3-diacylglucosamine diphosphatase LpxI n=1 Tax=Rhizobium setariae TaxID=2801340 RepID=A0A937CPB2_9HYPH|nr:UDP-2,3-diacylglucosamine diphosphatase LpxI [Rhizobium setariae]MBL0372999.1 UDP-2,3-diacylglucosamine diphosphatase LpxI [Rhizobium setariae]